MAVTWLAKRHGREEAGRVGETWERVGVMAGEGRPQDGKVVGGLVGRLKTKGASQGQVD